MMIDSISAAGREAIVWISDSDAATLSYSPDFVVQNGLNRAERTYRTTHPQANAPMRAPRLISSGE
jgi:hypothetical protein